MLNQSNTSKEYDENYAICPLTMKTVDRCGDAMDGRNCQNEDPCMCNFIFWPITLVIDFICCPCFYGYFRYNKDTVINPITN